jgi:hypothetical protein
VSKGSGVGRGLRGTRLRTTDIARRNAFLRRGLRGQAMPQSGLRSESFAHLRAGKAVHGGPPRVTVHADGRATTTDGRHRILLARERGQTTIEAIVQGMGTRAGIRWRWRGRIPI